MFPQASLRHLPRLTSDHCPILLNFHPPSTNRGPKPFKFERMWCLESSFMSLVNNHWLESNLEFPDKLNDLTPKCIHWNKHEFGIVQKKKASFLARIKGVQRALCDNPLDHPLAMLEKNLEFELLNILDQEQLLWMMKSRDNWITEGERNTSYFHKSVIIRRRKNRIINLKNEVREEIWDQNQLSSHIRSYLENLFTSSKVYILWD